MDFVADEFLAHGVCGCKQLFFMPVFAEQCDNLVFV